MTLHRVSVVSGFISGSFPLFAFIGFTWLSSIDWLWENTRRAVGGKDWSGTAHGVIPRNEGSRRGSDHGCEDEDSLASPSE